jgi:dipeptidyl aminopeptidase/acylaminoacyl peptidase
MTGGDYTNQLHPFVQIIMTRILPLILVPLLLGFSITARSVPVETGYREPPPEIVEMVDMAPQTQALLAPTRDRLLLLEWPALPGIADLAAPELRLAGIRFNPDNYSPTMPRYFSAIRLLSLDGEEREIEGLPSPLRALDVQWSPDGAHLAMVQIENDRLVLWHVDADAGVARVWSDQAVHAAWGIGWGPFSRSYLEWSSDSASVVFRTLPEQRQTVGERSRLPDGPIVTESRGRAAPARTFQDLLGDRHDERLFDYHFTTQLVRVGLDGESQDLGKPALIPSFSLSPNGQHVLVTRLVPPYSYAVPWARFAHEIDVWSIAGEFEYRVAANALADDLPIAFDAVIDGRRSVAWRADTDATLWWFKAADGGDPRREAETRDRLWQQAWPFDRSPELLAELPMRGRFLLAGDDQTALVWERWWDTRSERVSRIAPGVPKTEIQLLWERYYEDRYGDPGMPMTLADERGQQRLIIDDNSLFLSGLGASPEGNRPFVDRLDLGDLDSERLWRSQAPYFEQALAMVNVEQRQLLTSRESADEPPDLFLLDVGADQRQRLTDTDHPLPQMRDVVRELVTYEREDGVTLSANLLLPPGYDPEADGPLPTMVWAYPREFVTADAASQLADSPYRFNRLSYWSAQFLVALGYAVFDNATMPIIGADGIEPNDRFVEEITLNARAVIDAGVARGVTDPERVAVGGHSYGAFMTASLLAHTDLFRAGIARSGAYNRSLTPFGFQSEQRTLWDDIDLYTTISPFFHAHRIEAPLLIIHGTDDNNSGTFPMQSERLYQAMRGLGGTARLVMLPLESHGYRARESVLHMLYETINWLDEHLAVEDA